MAQISVFSVSVLDIIYRRYYKHYKYQTTFKHQVKRIEYFQILQISYSKIIQTDNYVIGLNHYKH